MDIKTKQEVQEILKKALAWEVAAQKNCEDILKFLKTNGFHKSVEHIKNDEIHHQEMVKQLINFLDKV
ncbi:MAG: hypothetical protein ACOYUZ_01810 [Patescibacteria group bacterium]